MKQFIKIESKGIIDPQAFLLLGASTKRDDNTKIGFFGSGLKYSIAYLLRNGINFKVFADYKEIKFGKQETKFRDKDFELIVINEEVTNMTTEMGLDWEAWFVLREIYCNAIDEGESSVTIVSGNLVEPIEDKTVFYIEVNDKFQEIINDWDKYFIEKRGDIVFYDSEANAIYSGGDELIVYRKGIRCYFSPEQKCSFNYDMSWIEINESRVIKSDWEFRYNLRRYLQKCKSTKVITHLYNTICNTFEKYLEWDSSSNLFSDEWLLCLNNKVLVPVENAGYWESELKANPTQFLMLPSSLINGLKSRFNEDVKVIGDVDGISTKGDMKVIEVLSKKQEKLLNDARLFLAAANYQIKYEIKVVDFFKKDRLGLAKDNTILLSQKLFDMGKREVIATIIEEQEHLVTDFPDESRAFQSHFINKYVSCLEEITGQYL